MNALAVAPAGSEKGTLLAGADIAGIFQSMDHGLLWTPAKTGLSVDIQEDVVALAWDTAGTTSADDTAFALVGENGFHGELLESTNAGDSGISWSVLVPQSAGLTENSQGAHPRNTGRMIAQVSSTTLYVGAQNGLWDCMISSGSCSQVTGQAWSGKDIRPVVADPSGTDLYVSAEGSVGTKVYQYDISSNSSMELTMASTNASLTTAWDMVPLSLGGTTYLFVADGNGGIYECDPSGLSRQCTLTGLNNTGGNDWARIDGTGTTTSNVRLYTVCAATNSTANCTSPNVEKYSGCATTCAWAPHDTNTDLINGGNGSGGTHWWLTADNPDYSLDGSLYAGAQIVVDPTDTSGTRIYLAGRSGVWEYDTGAAYSPSEWFPVPDGLAITDNHAIAAEALTGSEADAIDADGNWTALVSDAHMQCCAPPAPPGTSEYDQPTNDGPPVTPNGPVGLSAAVEPVSSSDSDVFVGVGDSVGVDDLGGAVYYCSTGGSSTCADGDWTDLPGMPGDGAVIGLAAGIPAGQTQIVVIAAVADEGIYYLDGLHAMNWLPASTDIGITNEAGGVPAKEQIDIQFSDGSTYAYVWAPDSNFTGDYFGLFQSTSIAAHPGSWNFDSGPGDTEASLYGSEFLSPDNPRVNYMAGEPGVDPAYLYITDATSAVRFNLSTDGATVMQLCPSLPCGGSSTGITAANGFDPGPVAVDSNGVPYVVNQAPNGIGTQQADVYQGASTVGSYDTTAVGGASYRQQILFASGIAVSGDGYLEVASASAGVAVAPPG